MTAAGGEGAEAADSNTTSGSGGSTGATLGRPPGESRGLNWGKTLLWMVLLVGVGYFVWNEWNNLALPNVIFAVLVIGVVGMLLDRCFAGLQKLVSYSE